MSRSRNHTNGAIRINDRVKNVLIISLDARWTDERGLVRDLLPCGEDQLNLPVEAIGEFDGVSQIVKVLTDRLVEREAPQIEQWLVCIEKAPFAVESVSE